MKIPRWLKILVAAALMLGLAFTMDWRELAARASEFHWAHAAVALLAIMAEMPVNASKWLWSLRLHDQRYPWRYLFRVSCMGYFYNNFMPSAIGGDVYRVYRTWPAHGERSPAVSAVVVERMVGLAIMLVNGFIGALFLQQFLLARSYVYLSLLGALGGVILLTAAFLLRKRLSLVQRFPKLAGIADTLNRILRLRPEWLALIGLSWCFQLLAAAVIWLCFEAVGSPIGFPAALLVTAAAGLASVLPISISGLGVVEGSIAGTAVVFGASYEAGVLAALLLRALALAVSALCGIFCFTDDGVRWQANTELANA